VIDLTKWYVLTGASCSGKTTLINKLYKMGFNIVRESARAVIDEDMYKGISPKECRINELTFQDRVLNLQLKKESMLDPNEIAFLDRGLPDSIAYRELHGYDSHKIIELCNINRYSKVFFLERLQFKPDYARINDSNSLADKCNNLIRKAYTVTNYDLIGVPVMEVNKRLKYILDKTIGEL